MKYRIVLCIGILVLAGCGSIGGPVVVTPQVDDGFRPGETLYFVRRSVGGSPYWPRYTTGPVSNSDRFRTGRDLEIGMLYKYSMDGLAWIWYPGQVLVQREWRLDCRQDVITDLRNCRISVIAARLTMWYRSDDVLDSICIIGHDFPGRTGAIRVGGNTAFITNTDGCVVRAEAAQLAAQLREGGEVITRYVEWPNSAPRINRHRLHGFELAEDLLSFLLYQLSEVSYDFAIATEVRR